MQRRASESGAEGQRGASIASAQCKRAGARWMKAVEVEAEASCGNGSRAEASRHAKKITTHAHKKYFFCLLHQTQMVVKPGRLRVDPSCVCLGGQ